MKKLSIKATIIVMILLGIHLQINSLQADSLDVCINEIAWMGTDASSTDEWIELYNNTDTELDLTNYTLIAEDGSPEITLAHTIPAKSYFVMERSNDNTISDMEADMVYTGSLGNSGECLVLRDSTDTVIDKVDCSAGWFAGDNGNKISMERINPVISGSDSANWASNTGAKTNGSDADSNEINGTPGQQNSVYEIQASVQQLACLPEKIRYVYNYPNPFNPSTTVHCDLSANKNTHAVSIRIFNLSGQQVRTLFKGKTVTGEHTVVWDGLDDAGRKLPSGIYFIHLSIENRIIDTAKMVKLK